MYVFSPKLFLFMIIGSNIDSPIPHSLSFGAASINIFLPVASRESAILGFCVNLASWQHAAIPFTDLTSSVNKAKQTEFGDLCGNVTEFGVAEGSCIYYCIYLLKSKCRNTPNCTIILCYLCVVIITSDVIIGFIVTSQCYSIVLWCFFIVLWCVLCAIIV